MLLSCDAGADAAGVVKAVMMHSITQQMLLASVFVGLSPFKCQCSVFFSLGLPGMLVQRMSCCRPPSCNKQRSVVHHSVLICVPLHNVCVIVQHGVFVARWSGSYSMICLRIHLRSLVFV